MNTCSARIERQLEVKYLIINLIVTDVDPTVALSHHHHHHDVETEPLPGSAGTGPVLERGESQGGARLSSLYRWVPSHQSPVLRVMLETLPPGFRSDH